MRSILTAGGSDCGVQSQLLIDSGLALHAAGGVASMLHTGHWSRMGRGGCQD